MEQRYKKYRLFSEHVINQQNLYQLCIFIELYMSANLTNMIRLRWEKRVVKSNKACNRQELQKDTELKGS